VAAFIRTYYIIQNLRKQNARFPNCFFVGPRIIVWVEVGRTTVFRLEWIFISRLRNPKGEKKKIRC